MKVQCIYLSIGLSVRLSVSLSLCVYIYIYIYIYIYKQTIKQQQLSHSIIQMAVNKQLCCDGAVIAASHLFILTQ